METFNAVAKARFASARPQRVHLHRDKPLTAELICLEPGQEIHSDRGAWCYYVVSGTVAVSAGDATAELGMGHAAVTESGEEHRLRNDGDRRAICLAVATG